jgi:deoxyribonuclease V
VIACVDVDYRGTGAVAAALVFDAWTDAAPARELVARIAHVPDYEPGQFYKRELPCLLEVLRGETPACVIIDGYVHLGPERRPGLGAHLADVLGVTVVGVAKNPFHQTPATPVLRGASGKPLLVTATGMPEREAAAHVRAMHGEFRIPTLLRRVDQLCRAG